MENPLPVQSSTILRRWMPAIGLGLAAVVTVFMRHNQDLGSDVSLLHAAPVNGPQGYRLVQASWAPATAVPPAPAPPAGPFADGARRWRNLDVAVRAR